MAIPLQWGKTEKTILELDKIFLRGKTLFSFSMTIPTQKVKGRTITTLREAHQHLQSALGQINNQDSSRGWERMIYQKMNLYITEISEITFRRQSHVFKFGMQNFAISSLGLCLFKHDTPEVKPIWVRAWPCLFTKQCSAVEKRNCTTQRKFIATAEKNQLYNLNTAFFHL